MLTKEQTQAQLNMIGYGREFTVFFVKKDGTQRKLTGFLEPSDKPHNGQSVSLKCTKGDEAGQWRAFRLDSVLELSA